MLRRSQRKANAKTVVVQMLLKNSVRRIQKIKENYLTFIIYHEIIEYIELDL